MNLSPQRFKSQMHPKWLGNVMWLLFEIDLDKGIFSGLLELMEKRNMMHFHTTSCVVNISNTLSLVSSVNVISWCEEL